MEKSRQLPETLNFRLRDQTTTKQSHSIKNGTAIHPQPRFGLGLYQNITKKSPDAVLPLRSTLWANPMLTQTESA